MTAQTNDLLLSGVRLINLDRPDEGWSDPVDIRLARGEIVNVGELRPAPGEQVLRGESRYCIPGLWDRHVHLDMWAAMPDRLDLFDTGDQQDVLSAVAALATTLSDGEPIIGMGYRSSSWPHPPRVADLDRVVGDRPVALVAGDGHNGWLSSAALRALGVDPASHPNALHENEWFAVIHRIAELESAHQSDVRVRRALQSAAQRGITGLVDMEFGAAWQRWERRATDGAPPVSVRTAVYPELFDDALALNITTGTPLAPGVRQGPLKIISDGSLGTLTAHCHHPYVLPPGDERSAAHPCGLQNVPPAELRVLLARARAHGFEVAVHAIGDAAVDIALDAFEATGARGGIEHAQLVSESAVRRMARHGVEASVQPTHLLDDAPVMDTVWPDRTDRAFVLRSLLDAGVTLAMGSDAPVAQLDPWAAIDAAVSRGTTQPWHPEQALTRAEALAASTDGVPRVAAGGAADLVLLHRDPLLGCSETDVALTISRGQITAGDF